MTELNGKAASSPEDIFKPRELPREYVSVPEWGIGVWISVMTGTQRDLWEQSIADRQNSRAKLIVYSAVREDGKPLFSPQHVEQLAAENSIALARLAEVAVRINRLTEKSLEDVKGK